ncbi:MAG: hypothetical protein R8G66_33855 [Cytophagales bacterium]|nr:hypothetical protein [Cytophagales bacterium]MDW3197412.1 hypothetical protein [Cytophagales bacterium]
MKKLLLAVVLIIISGLAFFLYQWSTFEMFPVESNLIHEQKEGNNTYRIYYLAGNATTEEVIQLKVERQGYEYLIEAFEGYNSLNDFKIVNDSTVQLTLLDNSYKNNKPDTLEIRID